MTTISESLRRIEDERKAKEKREQEQAEAAAARNKPRALARYLTVAGATVDIVYTSRSGWLTATCNGCGDVETTDTHGLLSDPPEVEDVRVEQSLPESRELAQAHAEKCRAIPATTT